MNIPHFRLDVSYYPTAFGSWSLTALHNPGEVLPGANLVLDDTFVYEWAFQDEQVPGQLEPARVSFTISAASLEAFGAQPGDAANLWIPQRGERMSFVLRIGNAGTVLASGYTMRITDARLTIVDTDPDEDVNPYPVSLRISAVDQRLELPIVAYSGDGYTDRRATLDRLMEMSFLAQCSVGLPTSLSRVQSTAARFTKNLPTRFPDGLESWANSQTVDELRALVATPYDRYGAFRNDGVSPTPAYPTGYSWCAPSNPVSGALADPASDLKVMMVPANPKTARTHKLPLRFMVDATGLLTLTNAPSSDTRLAAVDAAYVDTPTTFRSSRDHAPNLFLIQGDAEWLNVTPTPDVYETRAITVQVTAPDASASASGPIPRAVPTQLVLGTYDGANPDAGNTPDTTLAALVSTTFTPTVRQTSEAWTVDKLRILAYAMPQTEAESLLPMLAPRYPGELGSDGEVLRHLTIYNVADRVRLLPADGWIVAGQITIDRGQLVYDLTTQPGTPTYSTATPITVGDVDAASYQANPAGSIDPAILVSDLALVDA